MKFRNGLLRVLVVAAWLGLVMAGFASWEKYDSTAGEAAEPAVLPAPSAGWELILFLHPHCPCSRTTLDELAEVIETAPPGLSVRVVFVSLAGDEAGLERTELWTTASRLRGVRVECDADGVEARRTGATTSGHVVLYDPAGRLAFRGGLTRGRGRAGESAGRGAILTALEGQEPQTRVAPVFGCPLF
jgi:hypothetical protein